MSVSKPLVFRWGIISTGHIASCFVKDLLIDPQTRQVYDVTHKVQAVGSRSVEKAQEFIDAYVVEDSVKKEVMAYGSYDEVFEDESVDAVYIGTPHTYHYPSALAAIKAGKHVLCEKPVTSNTAELKSLLEAAKEKGVFFMEAMWTRFQPLAIEVARILHGGDNGRIGTPVAVQADLSSDFDIKNKPTSHRILDPKLGGGGLLDLGPYPLIWAILALYEHPSNNSMKPTHIAGSMLKTPITGVDANTSFTLTFPNSQAVLSTSILLNPAPGVLGAVIRCTKGTIIIPTPIYKPKEFTVTYNDAKDNPDTLHFDYVGGGWHFQADEVARCVRDGKKESKLWGWDKMILEMEAFDEVRKQGGYEFPAGVEHVV